MSFETILYDVTDNLATITLNRPDKLNAFNDLMIGETTKALKTAVRDPQVRAVLLTGSGRGFSSGQDLADVQDREGAFSIGDHLRHTYHKLVLQMTRMEIPVVAAVNGVAAGAGCGVALAADIRIASDKASFILSFSRVGLVPDSGTNWFLPRLIGYGRAYEMAITADKVPASTAHEWGMVNQVVPHDQLMEIATAYANKLANGTTVAFGLTKRAMYKSYGMDLEQALAYEAHLQEIAARTEDSAEGINAFLEKRAPEYKGK